MNSVKNNHHHRHWGLIGTGLLIGIWALGPVSITQAADQSQPEQATVATPTAQANSHETDAGIELTQIIAQSDLQSRVDELGKRLKEVETWVTAHKEIEKWVKNYMSTVRQHLKDEESMLNSNTGFGGF